GEISRLFERDAHRSRFDQPQRALALTYVTGMKPREPFSAVSFNLLPGVGEYFVFPALTTTGPCEIMVFEGVPGGPMDCWGDVKTPEQHLERSRWILDTFVPWEAERCRDIALTDDNGILAGRFAPTVRKPVATLPSGRKVLGMGDVVVLNDPITGQGSNNAAKCADTYLRSILARGNGDGN
ncbi:styrene monooxygenase/indole monooxygenase family protein, partial [Pseudomonas aeruginosa]